MGQCQIDVRVLAECGVPDETFEHLFNCGAQILVNQRWELLNEMARVAVAEKLPSQVTTLAFFILRKLQTHDDPTPTLPLVLDQVWTSQRRLGLSRFATGYVSKEWGKAMEIFGSKDPRPNRRCSKVDYDYLGGMVRAYMGYAE